MSERIYSDDYCADLQETVNEAVAALGGIEIPDGGMPDIAAEITRLRDQLQAAKDDAESWHAQCEDARTMALESGRECDRLRERVRELEAARDDLPQRILAFLGIDPGDECKRCFGVGRATYGSTATWRGGIGGQVMTVDVCNKCWGSGSKSKPWPAHDRARGAKP